jgi:hypothetical protein
MKPTICKQNKAQPQPNLVDAGQVDAVIHLCLWRTGVTASRADGFCHGINRLLAFSLQQTQS